MLTNIGTNYIDHGQACSSIRWESVEACCDMTVLILDPFRVLQYRNGIQILWKGICGRISAYTVCERLDFCYEYWDSRTSFHHTKS